MADAKITELTSYTTPIDTDVIPIVDVTTTTTKKITKAKLTEDKVTANGAIVSNTKTKITYDAKGLVTVGADANLDDLGDVVISAPAVDQVIKYNGSGWVNSAGATVSGSPGIEFFNDDISIVGIGNNNSNPVESYLKTPRTASEQPQVVETFTTTVTPKFGEAYLYNTALGRTQLDAGTWVFETYCSVNGNTSNTPQISRNVYQVIQGTGTLSTVRTLGNAVATQTATTGLFAAGDATADISTCGYLQTPQGLYEITAYSTAKIVTVTVPNGGTPYADETNIPAGNWKIWRKLFGVTTAVPFIGTAYGLVSTQNVQGVYTLTADGSDMIGSIVFARSTSTSKEINFLHNGEVNASHLETPLITLHNNLAGLNAGDYTHLSAAEKTRVTTSKTLHSVLLGNTTSAPEEVAPSTSGNVLTSNGTTWSSVTPTAVPVKASAAEVDAGSNDAKFVTAAAISVSHNVPNAVPSTTGNIMTSDGTDWISSAAPAGGDALMTQVFF